MVRRLAAGLKVVGREHGLPGLAWDLSVKVELAELAAKVGEFEYAYLVTVSEDGKAHVLSVWPDVVGDGVVVDGVGRHTQENVAAHPT